MCSEQWKKVFNKSSISRQKLGEIIYPRLAWEAGEMKNGSSEAAGIRVVDRVVDILTFMADKGVPSGVSEIAEGVGLSKSTVYRILAALKRYNVVMRDSGSLYVIGPTTILWSGAYRASFVLLKPFREYAVSLWKTCRETVHLFSYESDKVFYIDKLESPQAVTMRSQIGSWRELYCTAGGRAVLSALPEPERGAYLDATPLVSLTANTCTNRTELARLLEEGRERGYFSEAEENEAGIRCVAAAILDNSGYPMGAVSVSAPSYRMDDKLAHKTGLAVREVADKITSELRYARDRPN
jgi:DNA-binding IclR family transcriptional regulator